MRVVDAKPARRFAESVGTAARTPENLAHRLRNIGFVSALATLLVSSGAVAAPRAELPAAAARDAGGVLLVQSGDYDIFYDGHGNRVIVDPYTGKVVAVQPPQTRFDRRALRLRERQQRLDDGFSDDDYLSGRSAGHGPFPAPPAADEAGIFPRRRLWRPADVIPARAGRRYGDIAPDEGRSSRA